MNFRQLKRDAAAAVDKEPKNQELILIYAGIVVIASLMVTVVNYCLDLAIANTGGLSNIGTRSLLSTVQTVLPLAQSVVLICLELGFLSAVLRTVRGQYVSRNSFRLGFDRFWPLMRLTLLEYLIYFGVALGSMYAAVMIFLMTPFSGDAMAIAESVMYTADSTLILDEALQYQFLLSMLPMLPIFILLLVVFLLPISYRLRMAHYVLIDKPGIGAMAAMRQSRMMMKGNCWKLFLLDLSYWWYHLLCMAASVLAYGDVLLPLLGVTMPWSDTVSYFLFYVLYLGLQFAIYWRFLYRVTASYALTYDVIRPEDPPAQGLVLGNIFQM